MYNAVFNNQLDAHPLVAYTPPPRSGEARQLTSVCFVFCVSCFVCVLCVAVCVYERK